MKLLPFPRPLFVIFQSMIREFISMANVTLNSFVDSYEKKLPMVESNEFKMMISVLGKIRSTFKKRKLNFSF